MCGIAGYFGPKDLDLVPAARAILHRGPDMQTVSTGRGWKVAFNRLSILDLSPNGMQPFTHDKVSVFVNGEIYNYLELEEEHKNEFTCRSGSDVEILPYLYRKYGMQFLHRLNGMFAMVIIDERLNRYYLVRDRYGKKPLFYRQLNGEMFFASEIKALKTIVPCRPDKVNIAVNLSCWYLVQPLSLYEGVLNVNPGSYIEWSGSQAVERRWYEPRISVRNQQYDDIEQTFLSLYRQSIRLRLRSDVPVGIYLSGGLDSMSMAHFSRELSPENIRVYTGYIRDKKQWENNETDTTIVEAFVKELAYTQVRVDFSLEFWNRNIVRIVNSYEEIFTDLGNMVFYGLAAAARKDGVKVLLSGVGGDELFGGYPWQSKIRFLPKWLLKKSITRKSTAFDNWMYSCLLKGRNPWIGNKMATLYRLARQGQVWHAQMLYAGFMPYLMHLSEKITERIEFHASPYMNESIGSVQDDLYNQINYSNIFTVIGNQNYQVDIASMRHSVENRSPLLDYRLFEYMMSVPDQVKIAHGHKGLMRKILSKYLPSYVTRASKSGPTLPVNVWLRDDNFRRAVKRFLLQNDQIIAEFLSHSIVDELKQDEFYASNPLLITGLVSLVIWGKFVLENSIADENISFTELAMYRC